MSFLPFDQQSVNFGGDTINGSKGQHPRLFKFSESDFCIAALEDALSRYGTPEVCNTDQGCQFTSLGFIALLQENKIRISMDGRGCWRDNIMVERLWRSLKYENIYLHAYETGSEARRGINAWIDDYN